MHSKRRKFMGICSKNPFLQNHRKNIAKTSQKHRKNIAKTSQKHRKNIAKSSSQKRLEKTSLKIQSPFPKNIDFRKAMFLKFWAFGDSGFRSRLKRWNSLDVTKKVQSVLKDRTTVRDRRLQNHNFGANFDSFSIESVGFSCLPALWSVKIKFRNHFACILTHFSTQNALKSIL